MAESMTREQYDKLAADLAEMEGPKRAEIVDAIRVARGFGDLSENFEYHSAKNEQGLLERRITILRARLESAEIVDGAGTDVVTVGHTIVVENEGGDRIEVELSPLGGAGTASPTSPLGSAVVGKRVGDTVKVAAPRGAWQAKILEIKS
jgi:transcription elongation factor GreA